MFDFEKAFKFDLNKMLERILVRKMRENKNLVV